jgi:hypothetical protein
LLFWLRRQDWSPILVNDDGNRSTGAVSQRYSQFCPANLLVQ